MQPQEHVASKLRSLYRSSTTNGWLSYLWLTRGTGSDGRPRKLFSTSSVNISREQKSGGIVWATRQTRQTRNRQKLEKNVSELFSRGVLCGRLGSRLFQWLFGQRAWAATTDCFWATRYEFVSDSVFLDGDLLNLIYPQQVFLSVQSKHVLGKYLMSLQLKTLSYCSIIPITDRRDPSPKTPKLVYANNV